MSIYSDNWQKYKGEYEKYEYDIELNDGTIVPNCYPNGGVFDSINPHFNNREFDESVIRKIRYSQEPIHCINDKVSKVDQNYWYNRRYKFNI